jgi:hypothetical protein
MAMSDEAYERVVADLKRTRDHLPDFQNERVMRCHASEFVRFIGGFADHYAVKIRYAHVKNPALPPCDPETARTTQARGEQIRSRAWAMSDRVFALPLAQMSDALSDTAHRLCMRYRDATAPLEEYERALDEIDRELRICEQRAR